MSVLIEKNRGSKPCASCGHRRNHHRQNGTGRCGMCTACKEFQFKKPPKGGKEDCAWGR